MRSFTLRVIIFPRSARACHLPFTPFSRNYLLFSCANYEHIRDSILAVASVDSVVFNRAFLNVSLSFWTVHPANDVLDRFRQRKVIFWNLHVFSISFLVANKQIAAKSHLMARSLSEAFSILARQAENATVLTKTTPVYCPVSITRSFLGIFI